MGRVETPAAIPRGYKGTTITVATIDTESCIESKPGARPHQLLVTREEIPIKDLKKFGLLGTPIAPEEVPEHVKKRHAELQRTMLYENMGIDASKYGSIKAGPLKDPKIRAFKKVTCTNCGAKHNASDKHHDSCDYCRSYYE